MWEQKRERKQDRQFSGHLSPDSLVSSLTNSDILTYVCHSFQPLGDRVYVSVCRAGVVSVSMCTLIFIYPHLLYALKSPARLWITHLLPHHSDSHLKQPHHVHFSQYFPPTLLQFCLHFCHSEMCKHTWDRGQGKWVDLAPAGPQKHALGCVAGDGRRIISLLLALC